MILQCFQFSFTWDILALLGPWQTFEIKMCFKPATRRILFVYSLGVCSSHGVNPEEKVESQSSPPVCRIEETSTLYSGLAALCPRVLLTIQQCHPRNLTVSGFRGVSEAISPHTFIKQLPGHWHKRNPLHKALWKIRWAAWSTEYNSAKPDQHCSVFREEYANAWGLSQHLQPIYVWVVSLQLLLTSV